MSTLDAAIRALRQAHDDSEDEPVVVFVAPDRQDLARAIIALEAARARRDETDGRKWARLLRLSGR